MDIKPTQPPGFQQILLAASRIRPYVHYTPVMTCRNLDALVSAQLYFKCENFQITGSFKFRGAIHAMLSAQKADLVHGVATHSSGNHAQALARAAYRQNLKAYIVMPENAPQIKRAAVAALGAEIISCAPSMEAREQTLAKVLKETGATFIHSSNDYRVIVGQGTAALELLEEIPDLDILIAPVGGGGLISGTALAARGWSPRTRVIGAEPAMADDACRSLQAGYIIPSTYPPTLADGLRTSLGTRTFPILQKYIKEIILVSESAIIDAMKLIWERLKIVVEASAAVTLAAVMMKPDIFRQQRVGLILSGGNVDLNKLPWSYE